VPQPASQMVVPSTPPSAACAIMRHSIRSKAFVCVQPDNLCCPAGHPAEQAAAAVGIKMVALTLVQPAQDLVHGLCVPGADVQLHLQHTHPHKRATGWQANKR
jgi:hypothetical protein